MLVVGFMSCDAEMKQSTKPIVIAHRAGVNADIDSAALADIKSFQGSYLTRGRLHGGDGEEFAIGLTDSGSFVEIFLSNGKTERFSNDSLNIFHRP